MLIERCIDAQATTVLWVALCVNISLLLVFAIQPSGMARTPFKKWLTQFVPEPAERSTYVLLTNVAMILIFAFWQPMGGIVWEAKSAWAIYAIHGLYFIGWGLLFYATCAICHFDLFGLRQVWLYFRGKPYTPYEFRIPKVYKFVRHPLYVAWLVIFWAAPVMTVSHLLFAVVTTGYILVAIQFEERDLISHFGDKYRSYKKSVPMLIPRFRSRKSTSTKPSRVATGQH